MAEDKWYTRAVPILQIVSRYEDEGREIVQVAEIAEATGLQSRAVLTELKRLVDASFIGDRVAEINHPDPGTADLYSPSLCCRFPSTSQCSWPYTWRWLRHTSGVTPEATPFGNLTEAPHPRRQCEEVQKCQCGEPSRRAGPPPGPEHLRGLTRHSVTPTTPLTCPERRRRLLRGSLPTMTRRRP